MVKCSHVRSCSTDHVNLVYDSMHIAHNAQCNGHYHYVEARLECKTPHSCSNVFPSHASIPCSTSDWCALQEVLYKCIDTIQYNPLPQSYDAVNNILHTF